MLSDSRTSVLEQSAHRLSGRAVATHVRVGDPLFSHILFPVYIASFCGRALLRDRDSNPHPSAKAFQTLALNA